MQERLTNDLLKKHAAWGDKNEFFQLGDSIVLSSMRAHFGYVCAELLEARELIERLLYRNNAGAYNAGKRYLASIGRLEIESDDGVRVVGRLKP